MTSTYALVQMIIRSGFLSKILFDEKHIKLLNSLLWFLVFLSTIYSIFSLGNQCFIARSPKPPCPHTTIFLYFDKVFFIFFLIMK